MELKRQLSPYSDATQDEKKTSLELLRDQLRHMRSNDLKLTNVVSHPLLRRSVPGSETNDCDVTFTPPTTWDKLWAPKRTKGVSTHMLRRLESRLQLYLEGGCKRRGDLVGAIDKLQSELEQVQQESEKCQLDMRAQLQRLQRSLTDTTKFVEGIGYLTGNVIGGISDLVGKENNASANIRGEDERIRFRLDNLQKSIDAVRIDFTKKSVQKNSSLTAAEKLWTKLQRERDEADARLSTLKESFVTMVKVLMDESIIQVSSYTAASAWRRDIQLCGLLRNHPSVIAKSISLVTTDTIFSTAQLALHNSGDALALGLNPLGSSGTVRLMSIKGVEPSLEGATHMRQMVMPADACLSSIDWCDEHLLVGSTRGRIFVAKAGPDSVNDDSEILEPTGCLTSDDAQLMVRDIIVAPSGHAASTQVRSVQCNAEVKPSSVVAVLDSRAVMWDIEGGERPVRVWDPSKDMNLNGQQDALLFARWAPCSNAVVFTGSYDGRLVFNDIRVDKGAARCLSLPTRPGYMARCADFNRLLPFVVAAASSDGTISVFDCRFPSRAVRTISSLQGDVASLKWLRLHSDLLATGGIDGTVALWNLRFPPTYCVGRAQYKYPVTDLAATLSSTEQRVFGVTAGGELTLTGLAQPALEALTLSVTDQLGPQQLSEDVAQLREREKKGAGLLYARRLHEAYEIIADCAMERFTRKDTAISLALVGLTNVMPIPNFDYEEMMLSCMGVAMTKPHTQTLYTFEDFLARSSERLCTTLPLGKLRDLMKPNPEDFKKLEALRLNLLLQRVPHSVGVETAISGLKLFAANAGNLELVDSETACGIAAMLLKENYVEGERFVRTLLSLLIQSDGTVLARLLTRRLLMVVQEPLITVGLPSRQAKRHEERFLRKMLVAQEAIEVQLTIQGLGIERYQEVIATVNSYQKRCLEKGENGIFGWLAMKPLLLFLQALTADSNYATFFWVCVQVIDAFIKCPGARQVESILFRTVDRIHNAAHHIQEQLERTASTTHFSPSTLRDAGKTLRIARNFLVVLLRVQLECENVAIESGMVELPPVMARIIDILNTSSSDLLEAWATLLEKLGESTARHLVRKCCLGVIRTFSSRVKELMALSAKREEDETLNEVLDTCYDFLDKVVVDDDE